MIGAVVALLEAATWLASSSAPWLRSFCYAL